MKVSIIVHLNASFSCFRYSISVVHVFLAVKRLVSCDHDPSLDVKLLRKVALARTENPADWDSTVTKLSCCQHQNHHLQATHKVKFVYACCQFV